MAERAPHSPLHGTGWVTGWRLTFGGEELGWDGALATLVEDPDEQVYVAVYDLTAEDERSLDQWESIDLGHFHKVKLRVHLLEGDVLAWVYLLDAYEQHWAPLGTAGSRRTRPRNVPPVNSAQRNATARWFTAGSVADVPFER